MARATEDKQKPGLSAKNKFMVHFVTSVHLYRESTCAGTLLLVSALYSLSMPHLAGHTYLAFHLSLAYMPDCVPGRESRRWLFHRPNRRRHHPTLLLSNSRRSDMWFR